MMVLLMVQTSPTTIWDGAKNPVNNGKSYQPQLVSWISEPSTVSQTNLHPFQRPNMTKHLDAASLFFNAEAKYAG